MIGSLIHALEFDDAGRPRQLDEAGLREWQPAKGLLWLHLNASSEESLQYLVEDDRVPKVVSAALVEDETRPRTNTIGDGALILLRGVNLNLGADPEDMVSIRLWVDGSRVISTCRRRLLAVEDVANSLEQRPLTGTADLVVRLAYALTEPMNDVIDDLDERIADMERATLDAPEASIRPELADLRRDAIKLRRYLAPQREALGRLQGESLSWLGQPERLRLREVSDRLIRQLEDLDAVRERAIVVQEGLVSFLSDQLNQRMYVLSIVAALFLPLGFLTGLLGVNVGGIPGADNPYGFIVFISILVVLVTAQLWWFIKKKWF